MIDYLYTTDFTVGDLEKVKDKSPQVCSHDEDSHTFDNDTCFLSPYAFIIDMYTLGDKYDVPGLRAKACAHLKELFDSDPINCWKHDIVVWEYAYQHSRKTDELRALLVNKIRTVLFMKGLSDDEEFYPFVARCPEIADILLKAALDKIKHGTETKAAGT